MTKSTFPNLLTAIYGMSLSCHMGSHTCNPTLAASIRRFTYGKLPPEEWKAQLTYMTSYLPR